MAEGRYRVFVYGTLLTGEENHEVAAPYVRAACPGKVNGRLYNVGPYPALVLGEEGGSGRGVADGDGRRAQGNG